MREEKPVDALTRRTLLERGAAGGAALALLGPEELLAGGRRPRLGFGAVRRDPRNLLDLPRGFRYRVVQDVEDRLGRRRRGAPVPGDFDGMAAFPGRRRGTTVLVRNHELGLADPPDAAPVVGRNPFDRQATGGTTALVLDRNQRLVDSFVTSSGSRVNCAGGATPWGTWITCEEVPDGGYCFEVDPGRPESRLSRTPIRDMGVFSHEAVDVDPRTGIVYLTEDSYAGVSGDPRSRVSFLFRYLPENRGRRPGALQEGGKLQVLTIDRRRGFILDRGEDRDRYGVVWRTVKPSDPRPDAVRLGAARFQRLEGCHFASGALWFSDTSGGENGNGQLFRLLPSGDRRGRGRDRLELFLEGDRERQMKSPDNVVVAPWGDLWFVEDRGPFQRIVGVTPGGRTYEFAHNRRSEFAGPTFAPDGRTFYVNVHSPGHTLAITGPFPRRDRRRRVALAARAPAHAWAPAADGEAGETARSLALAPAELAAFRSLGVEL